jgi:hypothetical protein
MLRGPPQFIDENIWICRVFAPRFQDELIPCPPREGADYPFQYIDRWIGSIRVKDATIR